MSRYCPPGRVGTNGVPTAAAFQPRPTESYLSANWLEYFGDLEIDTAVQLVARAFREKSYTVKSTGRFAVLNVGAVKAVIAEAHERLLSIDHKKEPDDPSHAGITGYGSEDLAIAAELSALLASDDIYSVPDIARPV